MYRRALLTGFEIGNWRAKIGSGDPYAQLALAIHCADQSALCKRPISQVAVALQGLTVVASAHTRTCQNTRVRDCMAAPAYTIPLDALDTTMPLSHRSAAS